MFNILIDDTDDKCVFVKKLYKITNIIETTISPSKYEFCLVLKIVGMRQKICVYFKGKYKLHTHFWGKFEQKETLSAHTISPTYLKGKYDP